MNVFFKNDSKLNDIIFENRLKDYGAYELRKTAWIRELQGFLFGIALIFCILYPIYLKSLENNEKYKSTLIHHGFGCCYGCDWGSENFKLTKPPIYFVELQNTNQTVAFPPPKVVPDDAILKLILTYNLMPRKFNLFKHHRKINHFLIHYEGVKIKIQQKLKVFRPNPKEYESFPQELKGQKSPQFKNGLDGLRKYIKNSLKYPFQAKKNNIEGVVFVQFIVELDGTISYIKIINKLGYGIEKEALRLVFNMPKWKPAVDNWKPCRAMVTLPILFKGNN